MTSRQRRKLMDAASRGYLRAYPNTARAFAKEGSTISQPHIVRDGWLAFWRATLAFKRLYL